MRFEWDDAKAERNEHKHGVTFDYAARVFRDQNRLDKLDNRKEYNEERRIVYGEIEGRLYVICYVRRDEDIHRFDFSAQGKQARAEGPLWRSLNTRLTQRTCPG